MRVGSRFLAYALLAAGMAFRGANPVRALDALRRGLIIAQDSGNRGNESHLAGVLSQLEAEYGDPLAALDYLTVAIRNYHDSKNAMRMRGPVAILAALPHDDVDARVVLHAVTAVVIIAVFALAGADSYTQVFV